MKPILRIKDWDDHFENNRTRELTKLRYVIMPNKQDGDGYTELVSHPNGSAHLGAWCAIVQVASKCTPRGTLLREGGRPHDSGSLSRQTRLRQEVFDEVLPRLTGTIGWIEQLDEKGEIIQQITESPRLFSDTPQVGAISCRLNRREEDLNKLNEIKEEKERVGSRGKPRSPGKPKPCDEDYLTELQADEAYTNLNVRKVHAKMVRWCKEKGKVPTRMRLINWLNSEDQPLNGNGIYRQNPNPQAGAGSGYRFKPRNTVT